MENTRKRLEGVFVFREKEQKYFAKRDSLGTQPLEPLQSFFCPITRDVWMTPWKLHLGKHLSEVQLKSGLRKETKRVLYLALL
jgi:hypothetical protein